MRLKHATQLFIFLMLLTFWISHHSARALNVHIFPPRTQKHRTLSLFHSSKRSAQLNEPSVTFLDERSSKNIGIDGTDDATNDDSDIIRSMHSNRDVGGRFHSLASVGGVSSLSREDCSVRAPLEHSIDTETLRLIKRVTGWHSNCTAIPEQSVWLVGFGHVCDDEVMGTPPRVFSDSVSEGDIFHRHNYFGGSDSTPENDTFEFDFDFQCERCDNDGSAWEIPPEDAIALLLHDIERAEDCIRDLVHVEITSFQYSALVSWCANVGFKNAQSSSLIKQVNAGNFHSIPTQLMRWIKSKGAVVPSLFQRRRMEVFLWTGLLSNVSCSDSTQIVSSLFDVVNSNQPSQSTEKKPPQRQAVSRILQTQTAPPRFATMKTAVRQRVAVRDDGPEWYKYMPPWYLNENAMPPEATWAETTLPQVKSPNPFVQPYYDPFDTNKF